MLTTAPAQPLEKLSNDELCQSLGTYNSNGQIILKIYDEMNRRGAINTGRCFALEIKAKEESVFTHYRINTEKDKHYYPSDPTKLPENPNKIRTVPHSQVINPEPWHKY